MEAARGLGVLVAFLTGASPSQDSLRGDYSVTFAVELALGRGARLTLPGADDRSCMGDIFGFDHVGK